MLYGQFEFTNTKIGKFGEVLGLGWTVGEEILYSNEEAGEAFRLENCVSLDHSCLLQVAVDDLICMAT